MPGRLWPAGFARGILGDDGPGSNTSFKEVLKRDVYLDFARDIGLNGDAFLVDYQSDSVARTVEARKKLWAENSASARPRLFSSVGGCPTARSSASSSPARFRGAFSASGSTK